MKGNINEDHVLKKRKEIGTYLRARREGKGLSQQALADQMGINQTTVSKVEDGKWNFGIDTLTIFATHLDIDIELLEK